MIVILPRHLPAALVAALLTTLLAAGSPAAASSPAEAGPAGPTTVVALGDSAASGEGADSYEPGTRGEGGDWCHRSAAAYVHRTGLAETSVNLACSGADSAAVRFGTARYDTEPSQAQQLVEVARSQRVTTVTLQLGANDDVALSATAVACIRTFVDPTVGPCRDTIGSTWAARTAATATAVEGAVHDVRAAMAQAGYADGDYTLVLLSYASPVTERMGNLHGVQGCPYSRPDAGWARTVAFPALSTALGEVAARTGARFLDLSRATEGREACSRSDTGQEWQRRITVEPEALVYGRLDAVGRHLFQESFHPTAAAHAQIGRCLGEFVRGGAARAACEPGPDGGLQLSGAGGPAASAA